MSGPAARLMTDSKKLTPISFEDRSLLVTFAKFAAWPIFRQN
jgi:hypothetical protein